MRQDTAVSLPKLTCVMGHLEYNNGKRLGSRIHVFRKGIHLWALYHDTDTH